MPARRLHRISRLFGWQIRSYSHFRRALDILAAGGVPPFFLQIGANNGIDFDDLYEGVMLHQMPGIVVEPIADYFEALCVAYARHPDVAPVRAAVHPSASSLPMYRVDPSKVTRRWQHGLASLDRGHLLRSDVPDDAILEEQVQCLSFDELLRKIPPGRQLDVLAIDTEGFDSEILKMIDLEAVRPKLVRFESKHMASGDLAAWQRRFRALGYKVFTDTEDCVAISGEVPTQPLRRLAHAAARRKPASR